MSLTKYHAVKTVLALTSERKEGWKVEREAFLAIETLLKPYVDEDKFVLIPRYNDIYISFRYCGLEILRLSKAGGFSTCIESTGKGIRGTDKEKPVARLEDLTPLLDKIKEFLDGYHRCSRGHVSRGRRRRKECRNNRTQDIGSDPGLLQVRRQCV